MMVSVKKYIKEHPEDPVSQMFLEGHREHQRELRKWRMIGKALERIATE